MRDNGWFVCIVLERELFKDSTVAKKKWMITQEQAKVQSVNKHDGESSNTTSKTTNAVAKKKGKDIPIEKSQKKVSTLKNAKALSLSEIRRKR